MSRNFGDVIVCSDVQVVLASASERRADLLRSAGFSFTVQPASVPEVPAEGERPEDYTLRVARDKARYAAATPALEGRIVLAADTEVIADGRILGKPDDAAHAATMLRTLSASVHDVLTAVVVTHHGRELSEVVATRVRVAPMSEEEIDWYVGTGEPMGKAGAYAIQGLGARFIDHIEGSWSNVVGLPIATTYRLLRALELEATSPEP